MGDIRGTVLGGVGQYWHSRILYSLKEDFHGLKPYRGNFHQHSTNSRCCHVPELPAHVAAESRRIGMDFTTISDHSYDTRMLCIRVVHYTQSQPMGGILQKRVH